MFRHTSTILSQADATADNITGSTYSVRESSYDDVPSSSQNWKAVLQGTMAGASSPTIDGTIDGSWDGGTTFHTLASFTQVTAAGAIDEIKTINTMAPKVRASIVSGGDGTFTGKVILVSDGGFTSTVAS